MKNKWLALIILILTSGWILSRSAQAVPTTDISGTLIVDTTLTAANSPYFATGTVSVSADVTLTIQPGVEIRFTDPTYSLDVSGTLIAEGTADDPIVFTSADPNAYNWTQLFFRTNASVSLQHCIVEHAGSSSSAIRITGSDVIIADCIIRDGESDGVFMDGAAGLAPTLSNVTLADHAGSAIRQFSLNYQPTYDNLTIVGNGADVIEINGGSVSVETVTLVDEDTPYLINGGIGVSAGSELRLDPGVEMQFATADQLFDVSGTLTAEGTANEPIVFTSADPDSYNWRGIYTRNNSSVSLQHCVIEHAGSTTQGALAINSGTDVSIRSCRLTDNENAAIVTTFAQPTIKDNVIADNAFAVRNDTPSTVVDASFNYWGDATGPFHPDTNPSGQGNAVSDGVIFNPWYSSDQLTPVDLEVLTVDAPRTAAVGEDITVQYSVRNNGEIALTRDWIDSLYLSTDREFSIDDVLLTRHLRTGSVAAGATYSEQVTAPLTGRVPGDYYVLVIADSRKTVPDPDRSNNALAATTATDISINTLQLKVAANGTLRAGRDVYYQIDLNAGKDVLFSAELGGQYRGELYLRYGQLPTRSEFDFAASSFQDANQRILLKNAPGGDWYVLLHGSENAGSGSPYSLLADDSPFLLFDVSPDTGGDLGRVTMNVQGVGFDNSTTVALRNGPTTINPVNTELVDQYTLVAVFNLAGRPRATYDVTVSNSTDSDTIIDGFEVVEGTPGTLEASLVLPGGARPNRPFRAAVEYENVGDTDLAIPMLRVEAPAGAGIYPENYAQDEATTSLQFLALPDAYVSGGVIAPGQGGRYEFWAVIGPAGSTTYTLTQRTTADSDPFSRAALRTQIRPASPPDLWGAAWSKVVADIGDDTYGSFVTALTAAADEAHGYGIELRSVRELLGYMIQRGYQSLPADIRGTLLVERGGTLEPVSQQFFYLQNDTFADTDDVRGFGATTWYDGSFAVRDAVPHSYDVSVPGYFNPSPAAVTFDGSPITDLTVIVQPGARLHGAVRGENYYDYAAFALVSVSTADGELVAVGEADEWGRYEVNGLPANTLLLVSAKSDGFVPSETVQVNLDSAENRLLDLDVTPGGSVAGIVQTPAGTPLANVHVEANSADGNVSKTTTTNALGGYRIDGLPNGAVQVIARANSFAPASSETTVVAEETQTVNLSLAQAGTLVVTVRDADNVPIADAAVGANIPGFGDTLSTVADGTATLTGLPAGTVTVTVSATGYRYTEQSATVMVGQTVNQAVTLEPAGTIDGVVRNAGSDPLAAVPVALFAGESIVVETETAANGGFSFVGLPPGDYLLRFGGDRADGALYRQVTLDNANPDANVPVMLDGTVVSGTLQRADGTPLGQGTVSLVQAGQVIAVASVGGAGNYQFFVTEGGEYDLVARVPGLGVGIVAGVSVASRGPTVDQVIQLNGGAFSLAVSQGGSPVTEGTVTLRRDGDSEKLSFDIGIDAAGVAEIDHLPNGSYKATIRSSGGARVFTHQQNGSSNLSRTLAAGYRLSGQITAGGSGAASTWLTVRNGDLILSTITDSDGAYELNGIPNGIYDVWVTSLSSNVRASKTTGIVINGNSTRNFSVELTGVVLDGMVQDADGNPLFNALVRVEDVDGTTIAADTSDVDGTYRIAYLPNGSFVIAVEAPGYAPQQSGLTISGLTNTTRNFALTATALALDAVSGSGSSRVSSTPNIPTPADVSGITQPTRFPVDANFGEILDSFPIDDLDKITQETVDAEFNFRRAKKMADLRFDEWRTSYRLTRDTVGANVSLQGTKAALIAAKSYALMRTVSLGDSVTVASSQALNIAGLASDVVANVRTGDLDGLGLGMDSLAIGLTAMGTDFASGAGDRLAVLSILKDLQDLVNSIPENEREATKLQLQWLAKGDDYADAAKELYDALNQMESAFESTCGSGGGGGAPEPEEPEAPDEGEEKIVEQDETERRVSRDPNDIIGPSGQGPQRAVANDIVFDYTILYENVPTATAPAQVVTIEHQVDASHDYRTFAFGDFGFDDLYFPVPAGRQTFSARLDLVSELGVFVEYSAEFNPVTGLAVWEFRSVDPETGDLSSDPDIGFLPPNGTPPEGEGFVFFTVQLQPDTADGTIVTAQAEIIFDDNEPIVTPTWSNRIGEFYQLFLPILRR